VSGPDYAHYAYRTRRRSIDGPARTDAADDRVATRLANRTYVLLNHDVLIPPAGTPRYLAFATFANNFGNGAYLAVSVLFLTRSVGLNPVDMALGLSLGAVAGMLLTAPLGYVADTYGAKRTQIVALIVLAGAYGGLLFVQGLWSFAPLACVIAVAEATVKSANGAMVAGSVAPDERLRLRAYLRSVNNAGVGLGTLVGGIPLLLDTRGAYTAVLVGNAATFILAAAILGRAQRVPPRRAPAAGPRLVALRDPAFVTFALVDGVLASIYNDLLSIALPLWLVARTRAPLWFVSAALVINTLGCVLLQVRATRGGDGPVSGARFGRRGALVVGTACVLFGLAGGAPTWLVAAMVLVAAAVHVLGELWLSTGTWSIVFGLAPDWAQGQYQGTYFTGRQIGDMVSPPLLTACVVGIGLPGWVALGVLFAVAGLTYPTIVRWALRTRAAGTPAARVDHAPSRTANRSPR
jgi:MFS family permease